MVDIQIPDDLGDMSSILHGMVDLKDQFRRMTQLDLTSDLIADKTFRTVHGIQSLLLLFLVRFPHRWCSAPKDILSHSFHRWSLQLL